MILFFCSSIVYSQVQKIPATQVIASTNSFTRIIGSNLQLLLQSIDSQIGSGGGSGVTITWNTANSNNAYVLNGTNKQDVVNRDLLNSNSRIQEKINSLENSIVNITNLIFSRFDNIEKNIKSNIDTSSIVKREIRNILGLLKDQKNNLTEVLESKIEPDIEVKIEPAKEIISKQEVKNENQEKKIKILLVDDELVQQVLIAKKLVISNYDVKICHNGREALEELEKEKYDIVLTDIMMSGISGFDLSKKIREKEQNTCSHIPIIALTAQISNNLIDMFKSHGIDDYICKDSSEIEFLNKMKIYIK